MPYLDLALPSGVYGNGTALQARGRWRDANLVRFSENTVRPVGGWVAHSGSAVTGKARAIITWATNTGASWIAIGCHSKLYAMSRSGALADITPAGLTPGRADATTGGGYGLGAYDMGSYGTPRPDTTTVQPATVWTLDTWGEHLVAMNAEDGKAYEWDLNVANDAALISGSPTGRALVVTAERIMMILGAEGNPRRIKWSDAEDNADWTPSAANQARDFDLQTSGRLMCGKRLTGETGLWTDVDFWTASYTADTLVYRFDRKGSGCGAISQQAVAAVDSQAAWMSQNGFWTYNGYVQPLDCAVSDYVFSNINRTQASKVSTVHNSAFGEVWWFYPSAASNEIDRYVAWNYRENHWTVGGLSRLCGADRGAFAYPLMVGDDGVVYEHETGWSYGGAAAPFVTSGPVQIGSGDEVVHAVQLVADEKTAGDVRASFESRFHPNGTASSHGPYSLGASATDVRFCGRQIAMTVTGVNTVDWRWGSPRLELVGGGRR